MSVETNLEDKPPQQKEEREEKRSILSYFKKREVTPVKSKCSDIVQCQPSCSKDFENVKDTEEDEKGKEKEEVMVIETTPNKREIHSEDEDREIIEVKVAERLPITDKMPDIVKKSVPCKDSSSTIKESDKKASKPLSKSEDVAGKPKNIFAFMMANRAKQNEVIQKMAEDERANNLKKQEGKKETAKTRNERDFQSPQNNKFSEKEEVECLKVEKKHLHDVPAKKKIEFSDDASLQKHKRKPRRKKLKDVKGETLLRDGGDEETEVEREVSCLDEDAFVKEKVKEKEDAVISEKVKEKEDAEINEKVKEKNDVVVIVNEKVKAKEDAVNEKVKAKEDAVVNEKVKAKEDDVINEKVKEKKKDNSVDENKVSDIEIIGEKKLQCHSVHVENASKDNVKKAKKESAMLQNNNLSSGKAKSENVSLGNAFTLMMMNRHKMNKMLDSKENELSDESGGNVHSKSRKNKGRELEKSSSSPRGRKRCKRKSRIKEELDSSLLDFEMTPQKKRKRRRKSQIRRMKKIEDNQNSSEEEDEIFPSKRESVCTLDFNGTSETSNDEIEVIDNKEEISGGNIGDKTKAQHLQVADGTTDDASAETGESEIGSDSEELEMVDNRQQKIDLEAHRPNDEVIERDDNEEVEINGVCSSSMDESYKKERDSKVEKAKVIACDTNMGSEETTKESEKQMNSGISRNASTDEALDCGHEQNKVPDIDTSKEVNEETRKISSTLSHHNDDDAKSGERKAIIAHSSRSSVENVETDSDDDLTLQLRKTRKQRTSDGKVMFENTAAKRRGKLSRKNRNNNSKDIAEVKDKISSESILMSKGDEELAEDQTEPPKKRRKRINYIESDDEGQGDNDSGVNHKNSEMEETNTSIDAEKSKEDEDISPASKKRNISNFFKKISKEEKAVERSKNVITVKADVHAPCDGLEQEKMIKQEDTESSTVDEVKNIVPGKEKTKVRRSRRRVEKEIEDLNKIELLEQILISSPVKGTTTEPKKVKLLESISIQTRINNIADNKGNSTQVMSQSTGAKADEDVNKKPNVNDVLGKGGKLKKHNISQSKGKDSGNGAETDKIKGKNPGGSEGEHDLLEMNIPEKKPLAKVSSETKKLQGKKIQGKLSKGKKKKIVTLTVKKIKANNTSPGKARKPKISQNMKENKSSETKVCNGKTSSTKNKQLKKKKNILGSQESLSKSPEVNEGNAQDLDKSMESCNEENQVSSSDEIFVQKYKTPSSVQKKLSSPEKPSADPASPEMSEDKENIGKRVRTLGKKPKKKLGNVGATKLLEVGSMFNTYEDLNKQLKKFQELEKVNLKMHKSRSIVSVSKRTNRILNPALKYFVMTYSCTFHRRKLSDQTKMQNQTVNSCPFKLRVGTALDGQSLVVKQICSDHNHIIKKMGRPKKMEDASPDFSDSSAAVEQLGSLNNSVDHLCPPPSPISPGSKRKMPLQARKAMGRKLLSSQDNEKNRVQPLKKTLKTNGKVKKRSPKGKKNKLTLSKRKITTLQDDVIGNMVPTDVMRVNMAVVDNDILIVDSDSPLGGQAANTKLQKKRKLPPLVLKPPPKEQKSLKVKVRKKSAKKDNEEKISSKSKKEKIKVVVKEGSRRTSRQAAAAAKKTMEEQAEEEEEGDVSEFEVDSDDEGKSNRKAKAKEAKALKLQKKKSKDTSGKEGKLAPIFCKRDKSPEVEVVKVTLSPTKLKARQDFLQSGVPDQIKKQQLIEKCQEESISAWAPFPEVSHVQQKNSSDQMWNLDSPKIQLLNDECDSGSPVAIPSGSIYPYNIMSEVKKENSQISLKESPALDVTSMIAVLNALKRNNPSFPVFSVFRFYLDLKKEAVESYKRELERESKIQCIDLSDEETKGSGKRKRRSKEGTPKRSKKSKLGKGRKKKVEEVEVVEVVEQPAPSLPVWQERIPDVWTQVYAPKSSRQVIGNKGHIKKLKLWLQEWKGKSEAFAMKEKYKKSKTSKKGGDFIVSDDSDSWCEEDDSVSTYLLYGPPGVGKTATVYALAAELGYKVLEVNASSKRPGKQVMSQLAEATQSHSVSNTSGQPNNAIASFFATKTTKASKNVKKKALLNLDEDSRESSKDSEKKKGVSLVLFEDIDIVFDESDEGFLSTVNNLMTTTKRPIILTVSDLSNSALSKIKGNYEKIYFEPPPEDIIAQHLQLICLVNGQHICHDDVQSLVSVNNCDIRQSLLDVQVWSMSGSSPNRCSCISRISKDMKADVSTDSKCKDIPLTDIFTEAINTDSQDVELYKASLWGKVHSRYSLDSEESHGKCDGISESRNKCNDLERVTWSQSAKNLPFFLPFPLKEKKEVKKYPLKPDDPSLKVTHLWQKYNWLSIDEDEEEPTQPVIEETKVEEPETKLELPNYVKDTSTKCIKSLARLYDTFAQLDVMDSYHLLTLPGKDKRDSGWWTRHPTAGLSDEEGRYIHWAPHGITRELTRELGQRAVSQCCREIGDAIEDLPTKDWQQLSVPIQENERPSILDSQACANERFQQDHRDINERVVSLVPLVHQLTRNTYTEYLSFVRSTIRHDELSAVVSQKRRKRRVLSNTAQYGIDISAQDKIKLANSLT